MNSLPAEDLRTNLATWSVLAESVPAVTSRMRDLLSVEPFDPDFAGQQLETTYFDTYGFVLRAARRRGERYITLRVRHYLPGDSYALSVKTEVGKFRRALTPDYAKSLIEDGFDYYATTLLPPDLGNRLLDLLDNQMARAVTTVRFRRYAVEDANNRLTLDIGIETDTGKCFPSEVLEQKATDPESEPFDVFPSLGLRPIKLSKFLWATRT